MTFHRNLRNSMNLRLLIIWGCVAAVLSWSPSPFAQVSPSNVAPRGRSFTYRYCNNHQNQVFKYPSSALFNGGGLSENEDRETICIVGGGFGGLYCALALSDMVQDESVKPRIVLLDQKDRFVFLPLLYELCVGDAAIEEVAPTYESLLEGSCVEFVQANILGIDHEKDSIKVDSISSLDGKSVQYDMEYDSLVVATGTEVSFRHIPGAEGYALPFYTIEDCFELRRQLSLLDESKESIIDIAIVGAGYSGVELALNVGEFFRKTTKSREVNVSLIHRGKEIMSSASDFNRMSSIEGLKAAGVNILLETSVVEVKCDEEKDQQNSLVLAKSDGSKFSIDSDVLLWTAGNKPSSSVSNSDFQLDKAGRIVTGKSLRVKGTKNVFAIGDCCRAALNPFPATAQVAMQQASTSAFNILTQIKNKSKPSTLKSKLLPFRYLNLGEMLTLGSSDATINSLGGLVQINGPSASVLRRLIYSVRMPTSNQRVTAAVSSSVKRVKNYKDSTGAKSQK